MSEQVSTHAGGHPVLGMRITNASSVISQTNKLKDNRDEKTHRIKDIDLGSVPKKIRGSAKKERCTNRELARKSSNI